MNKLTWGKPSGMGQGIDSWADVATLVVLVTFVFGFVYMGTLIN